MSTHNVCFHGEIKKQLFMRVLLTSSYGQPNSRPVCTSAQFSQGIYCPPFKISKVQILFTKKTSKSLTNLQGCGSWSGSLIVTYHKREWHP